MHSSDIRAKRFSTGSGGIFSILGERYDASEVDAVMARCADALAAKERGEPLTIDPTEIVTMQFSPTRFARGYDPDEVDDYLDEIVFALRAAPAGEVVDASPRPAAALSAAYVREMTFSTRGMGAVDSAAVDAFLARCAEAVEAYERGVAEVDLTSSEVLAMRFRGTGVRLGYDSTEVDVFLGMVAEALASYEDARV